MSAPTILDTHRRAAGEPTPRWEATLRAFFGLELRLVDVENLTRATRRTGPALAGLSGTGRPMRELWCRVGRRGRKSFEAALIGIHEAAFAGHERYLVADERGLVAIISKDAAGSTLVANFAELHARNLGFATNWTSIGSVRVLEIAGVAFGVACFPCSARSPRGYAVPVVIADEIAHWATDADEYTNADTAVLGAVKPAMAQFPDAKLIAISSPLGETGLHFDTVEQNLGDDAAPGVLAVEGPTWEWNPEITEERTHEIERDPETHAREFGAKPSGNESTAFIRDDVLAAFAERKERFLWHPRTMWIDVGERVDTFAWSIGAWGDPDPQIHYLHAVPPARSGLSPDVFVGYATGTRGELVPMPRAPRPVLAVFHVGGWTGPEVAARGMDSITDELASIAEQNGCQTIVGDQRGAPFMAALLSKPPHEIPFRAMVWDQNRKHEAVNLLRAWMRDRQLLLPEHAVLRQQLLRYRRRIVGGGFRYGVPNQADDFAATLLTCAMQHLEEQAAPVTQTYAPTPGAPTQRFAGGRHIGRSRM